MEHSTDKGIGLEIEGGRIHFRLRGSRAPRSMPYADCTGIALRLTPVITGLGMAPRYLVEVLGRGSDPAILIGDTANLAEARSLWRRAASELEKPALLVTPDGSDVNNPPSDPPPSGIIRSDDDGRTRITVRRGKLEYAFVSALVIGLAAILALGESSGEDAIFMVMAAGLLIYAVIVGLASRFIEIAGDTLTAGLRTPLGKIGRVEMPLREIEVVLWGKTDKGWGNTRSAFAMATEQQTKSFDRLTEDQAKWLTRFVREAVRG